MNRQKRDGFLLLETMIAVAIFALGVLALARCVEQCLKMEQARVWDNRARLALENRMAEIEAGTVPFERGKTREDKLEGMFAGITLKQAHAPLQLEDERKRVLGGLLEVQLEARWEESGEPQSKHITLYVSPPR